MLSLHINQALKIRKRDCSGKQSAVQKKLKVKEPRSVHKAKKKQEKNEKRLKKEYAESVEQIQKKSI